MPIDPTSSFRRVLHSENILPIYYKNLAGYTNTEMDELLDALSREIDPEKRKDLWYEVQEIFAEDVPMIPLFEKHQPAAYSNERVGPGGIGELPGGSRKGESNGFMYVWLKTEEEEHLIWGLPRNIVYAAIGTVVVAIVAIGIFMVYSRRKP